METADYTGTANKYSLDLSLWLDDYEDIYSDFDSRNYLKRRISSDFVNELRTSLKNKSDKINNLVLLLPGNKRHPAKEQKITKGLKSYFSSQLNSYTKKYNNDFRKGIVLFVIALLLMIANSVISFQLHNNMLASIIRIALEPSGWFLIWISFDILYYDLQELKKEVRFFKELLEIKIYFQSSDLYEANE